MKKTFPVITILISLSLLGLILLQKSWLDNLLEVTEAQLAAKMETSLKEVGGKLAENTYNRVFRLPRREGSLLPLNFTMPGLRVDERYSLQEIAAKLKSSFENRGLSDLKFEFAIIDPNEELEMYTGAFWHQFHDTVQYHRILAPIAPGDAPIEELIGKESIVVMVPAYRNQVLSSLKWVFIGAGVFTLIILAAFYVTVKTLINQRKLSEIKSDFINNMTHEFKTPLATISLAVDALGNEKVQSDKAKSKYFSSIIKEENVRMNKHVETILQAALMEKQELQLHVEPLHVHDVIYSVQDNYQLQLKDKQGEIITLLNAKNDLVKADKVHFPSLVSNLIDNAIKYSEKKSRVVISTHCTKNIFVMRVEDNGIGMSKETIKRIFEKFYRAHTGNIHNVKGFGLGMSYVKTVIDAHKGKIKVESTLGKGSSFTIELPLAEQEQPV